MSLATHEWSARPGTDGVAAAPVALLIHGITGWWRTWWRVGPALADRGWRVIAVDRHGHGTSPRIEAAATAGDLTADVLATLQELGIAGVDAVIGHSLGAAVAMEILDRHPELARRAVPEDPPGQTRADALIGSLPPGAEAVELVSGHTIHRDRFDAYLSQVGRWLER